MENRKIFIGNLSFEATNDELSNLLSVYGLVKEISVSRKKGCAVVEMSDLSEAEAVVKKLNKTEFMGRPLLVEFQLSPKQAKEAAAKRYASRAKKFPDGKSKDSSERSPRTRDRKPFVRSEDDTEKKLPGTRFPGQSTAKFKKPLPITENKRKERIIEDVFEEGDFSQLERPDGERKFPAKKVDSKPEFKSEFRSERTDRKPAFKSDRIDREDRPERKSEFKSDRQERIERKPRTTGKFIPESYGKKSSDAKKTDDSKPRSTKNRPAKNRKTGAELRLERKEKLSSKKWFGDAPKTKKTDK